MDTVNQPIDKNTCYTPPKYGSRMEIIDLFNDKIAYYMTPKCGSRTVFAWSALMKDPTLLTKNPELFVENAKNIGYKNLIKKMKYYKVSNHRQEVRFCILRDPIDRFLSAYTNRILYHRDFNPEISIDELMERIDDLMIDPRFKTASFHFRTQAESIGSNPKLYTHIFKMSEMSKIKKLLEEYCQFPLPDLQLQQSGGIQKPVLTKQQVEWVKKRYEIDYQIYGEWMS